MEERIKDSVKKISMSVPEVVRVDFNGFNGLRDKPSIKGIWDELGLDMFAYLRTGTRLTSQVKCGSKDNFYDFGLSRQSFVLGESKDIFWDSDNEQIQYEHIQFTDWFLTGYELKPGIMAPWMLLSWPRFVRWAQKCRNDRASALVRQDCMAIDGLDVDRMAESRDKVRCAWNGKKQFAWARFDDLMASGSVISCECSAFFER